MAERERFLKVDEFAAAVHFSPWTIRDWISSRKIAHVKFGHRVRIPASEVERLIAEGSVPATSGAAAVR